MLKVKQISVLKQIRKLSTPVKITEEQIALAKERNEKLFTFNAKSALPGVQSRIVGTGDELYEPAVLGELAVLTGMPAKHQARTVMIAPRPFKTMQTGRKFAHQWQITWKNQQKWKNPLMGWVSSADPMSNVKLTFDCEEHAIEFAKRNGWKYEVSQPVTLDDVAESQGEEYRYKHNFLDPRTVALIARDGQKTKIFESPGFGKSNFFMPLKYHGDGEVSQHGPSTA